MDLTGAGGAKEVAEAEGITVEGLRSGDRTQQASRAQWLFCRMAVEAMGYLPAEVTWG